MTDAGPRRRLRRLTYAVGLLACVAAGFGLAGRYIPVTNWAVVVIAALAPYLMLASVPAVVAFAFLRRWIEVIFAAALAVSSTVVFVPRYIASGEPIADHVEVRVLSANLKESNASTDEMVRLATDRADIVAVQELTPVKADELTVRLTSAGFTYRAVHPRPKALADGVALWSRYPMDVSETWAPALKSFLSVSVRIPGVHQPASLSVVHAPPPWPMPVSVWRDGMVSLNDKLHKLRASNRGRAVVVVGDFNTTLDMVQFRQLLAIGYEDAAQQVGAGYIPTFPADSVIPPLLGLDHAFTRGCRASSVVVTALAGTDHLALMVTLDIPVRPTEPPAE